MEIEETDHAANKVSQRPHVWGLFKNVQMQGAQKPNREAYNLKVTCI